MSGAAANEPGNAGEPVTTYACTFGIYNQTTPWSDVRHLPWTELAMLLTTHEVGQKMGTCLVPATFSGTRRAKADAVRIDVVFLDSDAGYTLEEISTAIAAKDWRAIISSTHSHLTTTTLVKRGNWDKYRIANEDQEELSARYLIEEKGMLARVAADAIIYSETDEFTVFAHQPCPKFRVALPLLRPWLATSYEEQRQVNAAWKERIEALAAALGLSHDQACTDTSRLFYLPRRTDDASPAETAVLEGELCDIFALPHAASTEKPKPRAGTGRQEPKGASFKAEAIEFVHQGSGERVDLTRWAAKHSRRFELASALKARRRGRPNSPLSNERAVSVVHVDQ